MKPTIQQIDSLFQDRRQEIIEQAIFASREIATMEMNLFEFELLFSATVSKKKIRDTNKFIKGVRNRNWTIALKRSKGDKQKALKLICESDDL
jgi:hypothetical protein